MLASRGHRAHHPLLTGMFVGTNPPPPAGNQRAGGVGRWGPRAEGGEMSGAKCKFKLTSGAENMFSATRGTLIFHKVK